MGSKTRLLQRAWRALGSTQLAAILMAALLLATLAASLFPQMPGDPAAREPWLSAVELRFHGATRLLFSLGLFGVYQSPWYLALLAGLLASTVACTLQRLPRLWRSLRRPPAITHPDAFYEAMARRMAWPHASLEAGLAAAQAVLLRHGYQVRTEQAEAERCAYVQGERGRWSQAGTIVSHVAALLLVAAVMARPALSHQVANVTLLPDQRQRLELPRDLAVEAGSLVLKQTASGELADIRATLTIVEAGAPVASQMVRVNHPLTYQGTAFYLQGYGSAVQIAAPEGRFDVALDRSLASETWLPEAGVGLRVASSPEGGSLFIEASDADGAILGSGEVLDGQTIEVTGTALTFVLSHYSVWQVVRDPTFAIAVAAAGALLAGILVSLWVPHRRVWLHVTESKTRMVGAGDLAGDFEAMAREMGPAPAPAPEARGEGYREETDG